MKIKVILGGIVAVVVIICVVLFYNFALVQLEGKSMENSIKDGQAFVIKKHVKKSDIKRYDIIMFKASNEDITVYSTKRVYGLPGETIQIKNNKIYIDGKVIKDKYAKEKNFESLYASKKITLGKDQYFVLGDNRNNSNDSRNKAHGNVKFEDIKGKTVKVFN